MTHSSAADVARTFYQALSKHDIDSMVKLYHPQATFSDPVFRALNAAQVSAMWRMLSSRSPTMRVTSEVLGGEGQTVRTHWDAYYTFSQTKRPVHNSVTATMTVQGGLITEHTDSFDFWGWSRQALGVPGLLLGWTPLLHNKVSQTGMDGLAEYMGREA